VEAVEETPGADGQPAPAGLNPRQQRFVAECLVDLNGGAAYQRAGYKATGASARVNASKLLKADDVVRELARIAYSNILDVCEWGEDWFRVKPSAEVHADAAPGLASIRRGKDGTLTVTMRDKSAALLALAKRFGLLEPKRRREEDLVEGVECITNSFSQDG
jgi:phage terminase small subunit